MGLESKDSAGRRRSNVAASAFAGRSSVSGFNGYLRIDVSVEMVNGTPLFLQNGCWLVLRLAPCFMLRQDRLSACVSWGCWPQRFPVRGMV